MEYNYDFKLLNAEMEYNYLVYLTRTNKMKWLQRAIKKNCKYQVFLCSNDKDAWKSYRLNKTNLSTRFFDYLEIVRPSVKECEKKYPSYRNQLYELLEVFLDLLYTGKLKLKWLMHWTERFSEFIYQRYWPRELRKLNKINTKPAIRFHDFLIKYMAESMERSLNVMQTDPEYDDFRRYMIYEGNRKFPNSPLWNSLKVFLYTEEELLKNPKYKIVNIYDANDLNLKGGP